MARQDDDDDIYNCIHLYKRVYIHAYICVCVHVLLHYIYIYIYIYIVIHRETVSLYHNFSVWLDTQDVSRWDRNPTDFSSIVYLTPKLSSANVSKGNF